MIAQTKLFSQSTDSLLNYLDTMTPSEKSENRKNSFKVTPPALPQLSKKCAKYAIPAVCHSTLPLCDMQTQRPRKVSKYISHLRLKGPLKRSRLIPPNNKKLVRIQNFSETYTNKLVPQFAYLQLSCRRPQSTPRDN